MEHDNTLITVGKNSYFPDIHVLTIPIMISWYVIFNIVKHNSFFLFLKHTNYLYRKVGDIGMKSYCDVKSKETRLTGKETYNSMKSYLNN